MSLVENAAAPHRPRLLLVDDHLLFMLGLKNLLREIAPTWSVDLARTADEAVRLARAGRYDVVLLDWHLEGGDASDCMAELIRIDATSRVVVVSGETRPAVIRRTIEAGAAGFLPKKHGSEQMLGALDAVMRGGTWLPPEAVGAAAAAVADESGRLHELTGRQLDVYRAAARGLSNKMIARELGIAESTVKTHLTVIYAVLGVRNRTEAVYQASLQAVRAG